MFYTKASNNLTNYQALLAWMKMARKMGIIFFISLDHVFITILNPFIIGTVFLN